LEELKWAFCLEKRAANDGKGRRSGWADELNEAGDMVHVAMPGPLYYIYMF